MSFDDPFLSFLINYFIFYVQKEEREENFN